MYNDLFSIGSLTVHTYGLCYALAAITAVLVARKRAKARGMDPEEVVNIALYGVLCGVIGAKLFYVVLHLREVIERPRLLISGDGLLMYGALMAVTLFLVLYFRKKKLRAGDWLDVCMPCVSLAQCIGRIGCFFAGCCYGIETDSPLGVVFPAGNFAPSGVRLVPTQLISAAGNLCFAFLGFAWTKKETRKHTAIWLYMALLGSGRFVMDFFRGDKQNVVGTVSVSQWISLAMALAGVLGLVYAPRIMKRRAAAAQAGPLPDSADEAEAEETAESPAENGESARTPEASDGENESTEASAEEEKEET